MKHLDRTAILAATILLFVAGTVALASAQATLTGDSSAVGESVAITGAINVSSGPLPTASGNAPPPYGSSNSVLTASVPPVLQTGLLEVAATSNVDGSTGSKFASADATVHTVNIAIGALLTISATTVGSTADVTGSCGKPLTGVGTTTIENAVVGGTLGAHLAIAVNPAPNTVLLNAGGIRVVLNEQIPSGNGTDSRGLIVNAIHVRLTNVPFGLTTISGDIIVSDSQARLVCHAAPADVSITKTATPDPVRPGQPLTYEINVTNHGPNAATHVVVTDTLPLGAHVVSMAPSQGSCTRSGDVVTCKVGTLTVGATARIAIVVTIDAVVNKVKVKADQLDPDKTNNQVTISTGLE